MENNSPKFSFKSLFAVFGVLMLAGITGATVYRINAGESFSLSFAQKPIDPSTELRLLENYYSNNNIALPQGYTTLQPTTDEFKISILKPGIVKRELFSKSGAVIVVGFTAESEPKINFELDKYRQKFVNSSKTLDEVFEIFEELKASQTLGSVMDSNFSAAFGPITKNTREFPDKKISNDFWASPKGTVSEIIKLSGQNKYALFVVSESNDRGFATYEEWLKASSRGR